MTAVLDDLPALQRKVAKLKEERDREIGERNQLIRILKREFKVGNLKAAKKLQKRLHREMMVQVKIYTKLKKKFERELNRRRDETV